MTGTTHTAVTNNCPFCNALLVGTEGAACPRCSLKRQYWSPTEGVDWWLNPAPVKRIRWGAWLMLIIMISSVAIGVGFAGMSAIGGSGPGIAQMAMAIVIVTILCPSFALANWWLATPLTQRDGPRGMFFSSALRTVGIVFALATAGTVIYYVSVFGGGPSPVTALVPTSQATTLPAATQALNTPALTALGLSTQIQLQLWAFGLCFAIWLPPYLLLSHWHQQFRALHWVISSVAILILLVVWVLGLLLVGGMIMTAQLVTAQLPDNVPHVFGGVFWDLLLALGMVTALLSAFAAVYGVVSLLNLIVVRPQRCFVPSYLPGEAFLVPPTKVKPR